MPLSLLEMGLGFLLGVVGTAIVFTLGVRRVRSPPLRLTLDWSLEDLRGTSPEKVRIFAEYIGPGMEIPEGSKILLSSSALSTLPPEVLSRAEVRVHPQVQRNAAVGPDRALLILGAVRPRTWAALSTDEEVVLKLKGEFSRLWPDAEPYYVTTPLSGVERNLGKYVETEGKVEEIMDFRGRKVFRLHDPDGGSISVLMPAGAEAPKAGTRVKVRGKAVGDVAHAGIEARVVLPLEETPRAVAIHR